MIDYIGCIIVFGIALLLSKVDSIGSRETKIITILGWLVALFFAKGGI